MYSRFRRLVTRLCARRARRSASAACDIAVDGHGGLNFDLAAGKAQDEWTRSYKVAAGGRLEIINVNGRITAEASDGDASRSWPSARPRRRATTPPANCWARSRCAKKSATSRVRVEVRAPRLQRPSGHEIKWTIKVPRGVAVDLRTVNGGVQMVGAAGRHSCPQHQRRHHRRRPAARPASTPSVTNGGVEIELAIAVSPTAPSISRPSTAASA